MIIYSEGLRVIMQHTGLLGNFQAKLVLSKQRTGSLDIDFASTFFILIVVSSED